jgi:hypothetical protein
MARLDRIEWALARARAMSAAEVSWRIRRGAILRAERLLAPLRVSPPLDRVVDSEASAEELLFGRRRLGFLPWEGAGRADLARALAGAGGQAPDQVLDWNRDPLTGLEFPLAHWSALDYRRPTEEGAIRRLWYRARHGDLAARALPYYLTQDEPAAASAAAVIASWIEQCPPGRGIHWLVPLEVAIRLIAWSTAARLLAGSRALAALAPALACSVHLQAEHVLSNLSRFSSANNHLIAQAAGLLHAGIAFSGLRRSVLWRETGREILSREILRQTTEDGVSREASLHYHEFVIELAILAWLRLEANGEEPPAEVRDRIGAMLDFVAEAEAFPGGAPEFGDSDNQTVLPLAAEASPRRSLLAVGAVLFARGDWKALARGLTPAAAFLLGEEGRGRFAELVSARPRATSRLFRASGYAFLRDASGDRALFFDAGELGYLETAAHGHADCLAIVLGAFGAPLVVDPGTYTYHAEPAYRDFFRSTAAHSTLRVDLTEQSEMRGPFLWGRRAHGRIVRFATSPAADLVIGEHDGYQRLASPVSHRRHVVFVKPDYVWVRDELAGAGEHLIESCLQLAPGMAIEMRDPSSAVARSAAGVALDILALGAPAPEWDWLLGSERPRAGWVSPAFGELRPAPMLRLVAARSLPAELHLLLRPRLDSTPGGRSEPRASVHALARGQVLVAAGMPGEDLVAVGGGAGVVPGGGCFAGDVDLDGELGLVRFSDAELCACAGLGLRRLVAGGRVLAESRDAILDFCFRRLGEHAVVEGRGGRLRLWAPGVGEVRRNGTVLPVTRAGDWIELDLGAAGPREETG